MKVIEAIMFGAVAVTVIILINEKIVVVFNRWMVLFEIVVLRTVRFCVIMMTSVSVFMIQ